MELKKLDVSHNQLTSLDFLCEAFLKRLGLRFTSHPSRLFSLLVVAFNISLTWLNISDNKFESLVGLERLKLMNGMLLSPKATHEFFPVSLDCVLNAPRSLDYEQQRHHKSRTYHQDDRFNQLCVVSWTLPC